MSEEKEEFWAKCSMSKEDMGEVITLFRKDKELEQEDLAKEIGCTVQMVKSAENGKGAHVYGTFMKMCDKYNLSTALTVEEVDSIV